MVGSRWSTRLPGLLGSVRLVVARPVPRLREVIAQARLDTRRRRGGTISSAMIWVTVTLALPLLFL